MTLGFHDHVAAVEREVPLVLEALRAAPPSAAVPTCPGWTLADLATHLGEFTALWTHVLDEAAAREKSPYAPLPEGDDLASWYEPIAGHLVDALHATTAGAPAWMWIPEAQNTTGIARRCANELSFHRYDAQAASATVSPLDPAVAGDAIDEIFVMLPVWGNPPDGSGHTLHLHGEEGGEWTITLGAEGPRVKHEHAEADLTLLGAASDLALVLFRRPTLRAVTRQGEAAALDAWYREFLFD